MKSLDVSYEKIRQLAASQLENDLKLIVRRYNVVNSSDDIGCGPFHPDQTEWRVANCALGSIERMIEGLKHPEWKTLEERLEQIEQQLSMLTSKRGKAR